MPSRPLCVALCLLSCCGGAQGVDRLDPRDFDTATAACRDAYQYANGNWLRATPVAAEDQRINRLVELQTANQQQRGELLSALQGAGSDPLDAPLAALIASALDEQALLPAREAAFAALLPALAELRKPAHAVELLASLQARGVPVAFSVAPGAAVRTLALQPTALSLGDPAFHTDATPAAQALLGRYRGYVQSVLAQTGSSDVDTDSAWVLDFEGRLARGLAAAGSAPVVREYSLRELQRELPALQWKPLLKASGLAGAERYRLDDARVFVELDRLVAGAPPVAWRAWLRFRIGHLLAPYVDAALAEPHQRFFAGVLRGDQRVPARRAFAQQLVQDWLGEAYAQRWLDTHFAADRRAAAEALVDQLRGSLRTAIEANTRWQPATRERALAKLAALHIDWNLPASRPELGALRLHPGNLVGNLLALARWRQQQALQGAPAAVDPLRPQLDYLREHNRLVLSPALFQPPLYAAEADPALHYGGLGALIARALAQGFDLGGASFAADGGAQPWWEEADRAAWLAAAAPLVTHYGRYPAIGKRQVDGERTLHENMADLAGLSLAWRAFVATGHALDRPKRDGHTPAQRFHLAWASLWRENAREALLLAEAGQSVSVPAKVRANATLALLPSYAQAFACKPKQAMATAPKPAVQPWP